MSSYDREGLPGSVKLFIGVGAVFILGLVVFCSLLGWKTVPGNEVGVRETFSGGVDANSLPSKTYFYWRITERIFTYPLSMQVFVMNDVTTKQGEKSQGREQDSYLVQSAEGQDMHISLSVQYRIDPIKVIEIHKTVRDDIPEKLIRPVVMRVVKDQATKRTATSAYSGEGLVSLQKDIFADLSNATGELRTRGVVVENFVIEGIRLNEKYIAEITERQVAMQRKLKEDELTKAATAASLRVEAEAQANLKQAVVAAQRDKEVGVLNAERDNEMAVLKAKAEQQKVQLAAEAEQKKLVMEATGHRDASILEAEGTLAKGKAEAEAQKLRLSAYAVSGADSFVKIEVAKAFAQSTQGIQGYLPSDMHVYTLGNNFSNAVNAIMKNLQPSSEPATQK
jgi:regulator of protease activity HflC (stomatin/prohibitin superfamily)